MGVTLRAREPFSTQNRERKERERGKRNRERRESRAATRGVKEDDERFMAAV